MSPPEIDTLVFFFINQDIRNRFLDIFMPFITQRAYLFFLPFYLWIFFKDRKKAVIIFILAFSALLVADWSANMLKHYFERIRPCNELDGVRLLTGCGKSYSMPSNHAVNAFAFAAPFYIMLRSRLRHAFAVIAILTGFSRIYVGVHYPSDVLVGAVVGILMAIMVIKFYHRVYERYQTNPYSTVLIIFLISITLFRIYYILNGPLDLSPDEAHYWEWSRRLDLSYYSKGPIIAYLIYIGTTVFGDTVFGIRIMAVILSVLSSVLLYKLGKEIYDEKVGISSAILLQIIPLFSTYGIVFTIDSPFIFFWILSLYLFWKAVNSRKPDPPALPLAKGGKDGFEIMYWRLLGLSIGLGLLTKYTMAFFFICALIFLLLSKEHRKIFLTKGPYLSFIISLVVFAPVILWNVQNDWVTFKHTAGQAHVAEGVRISLKSFFEFIGSQLGVITPLLLTFMAISLIKLRKDYRGAFLFWFSVPVFVFFLLKSIQAKVQANWPLPGYLTGIIAFAAFYIRDVIPPHSSLKKPDDNVFKKGKKILLAITVIISLMTTATAHYPSILGLPVKLDPTMRLQGWEVLGKEVTSIYKRMSSKKPAFIFSDRYQISSELAFYVKGHPVTYCINLGRRMNQYDLWPGFNNLLGYDAIFVRMGDVKIPKRVEDAFTKVEKRVFTAYTKKDIKIRDYSIFLCYDFKGLKEKIPETY